MKIRKLADAAVVAALLLANIPGLADDVYPDEQPIPLIQPAPAIPPDDADDPAERPA